MTLSNSKNTSELKQGLICDINEYRKTALELLNENIILKIVNLENNLLILKNKIICSLYFDESNIKLIPNFILTANSSITIIHSLEDKQFTVTDFNFQEQNEIRRRLVRLIDKFILDLEDRNESSINNFWDLINPELITTSQLRFEDGYYSDAVSRGCILVESKVKKIHMSVKNQELKGSQLMNLAFNENGNGSIQLNSLTTSSEISEQKGYKNIFAGVMECIRNLSAHELCLMSKEEAIHNIFLISMLLNKLDKRI